jgi:hypothetical protein
MTETQFIDPAKASSALGRTVARLLQVSGLEVGIDEFGEIDEIATTLKSLQAQLIELDRAWDSDVAELKDRFSGIEDVPDELTNLELTVNKLETSIDSRLSKLAKQVDGLAGDFSNLYDSIPIADRPALDSQAFSSGNDNDDDDGADDPFCS